MEDSDNSPEYSSDSPRSGLINMTSASSPKTSRRAIQKRVVSVPIKDVEGLRHKGGEMSAPPSDSWAWRKYGQKPIKGSPYPRGYYRCSSSKGCPARKQVERSRVDPNMVVVTYSCDHNHPSPASRNNHMHRHSASAALVEVIANGVAASNSENEKPVASSNLPELCSGEKFSGLGEATLRALSDEFGWFADLEESPSSRMLEGPILAEDRISDADVTLMFSMREEEEEEESLFADLGELPECSVVFRRGVMERTRHCGLASWCGTTI